MTSTLPPLTHPKPRPSQRRFIEGLKTTHFSSHRIPRTIYPRSSGPGAEPGVNPREGAQYAQFKSHCLIDIIDFDADDVSIERVGNADFISMMKDEIADSHHPRAVRWIDIAGIDWDVLSSMALRYHIHSLALEDVLHDRGDIQSKADYYPDHMFIRILCHSVHPKDEQNRLDLSDPLTHYRYGAKRRHYRGDSQSSTYKATDLENLESGRTQNDSQLLPFGVPSTTHNNSFSLIGSMGSRAGLSKWRQSLTQTQSIKLDLLTAEDRPNIHHDPMCIFLFLDGTVISLMPTSNLDFTAPITERLYNNQSILRISEDPSLLMQALLDLVVDRVLEVIDEYQVKIHSLEHDIILNPNMDTIRRLHVLSGDLIMHKLTLEPIKAMMYNLRENDARNCLAIAEHIKAERDESSDSYDSDSDSGAAIPIEGGGKDTSNEPGRKKPIVNTDQKTEHQPVQRTGAGNLNGFKPEQDMSGKKKGKRHRPLHRNTKRCRDAKQAERSRLESTWHLNLEGTMKGYLSYTCKIYMANVCDHMDFAMTSLDMFAGVSENLINYAFNVASYETNRVMTRLTVITMIFLPPALLTGYFGMSFDPFTGLDGHSVTLFWKIVIPVMAILIPLFMFHEVQNFVKKIITAWNISRAVKA